VQGTTLPQLTAGPLLRGFQAGLQARAGSATDNILWLEIYLLDLSRQRPCQACSFCLP